MKRQPIAREQVYGPIPEVVARRLAYTLENLEEEPRMKKRSISVLVAVLLLVLAGLAYAAVTGGLQWYYKTYVDYGGRLPQDVAQRIQEDIPQETRENPLVNITVVGAAWLGQGLDPNAPDNEVLDILIRASVKDPDRYEMVHSGAIDTDGVRGEEERLEHPLYAHRADEAWLWANGTHGPVDQVMRDPSKELLLFGKEHTAPGVEEMWAEWAQGVPPAVSSYMLQDEETGEVVANYSLSFSPKAMEDLREHADQEGYVTLVYRSWAGPFVDRDPNPQGETGLTAFRVKLP